MHVHLEREALLEAVEAVHIAHFNAIQRFLRQAQRFAALAADDGSEGTGLFEQLVFRHHLFDGTQTIGLSCGQVAAGKEQRAYFVQRNHSGEMRRAAHGPAVDLRQREERVVRGNDHIAGAANADTAANHEAMYRSNHRHFASTNGLEGEEVAAVQLNDALRVRLHLFNVHAGAKAAPFGADKHAARLRVLAGSGNQPGQFVPLRAVEGIDRRLREDDFGHGAMLFDTKGHGGLRRNTLQA